MARLIRDKFKEWEEICNARFEQLKAGEEEINRIFTGLYGLQDEISCSVEDKDVTVRRALYVREIRSLLSYAVGCLFGRYSLDEEGLVYAGGVWDPHRYRLLPPVEDNILVLHSGQTGAVSLTDRIVSFVQAVYGEETLDENLDFIASALGGSGTAREIIEKYLRHEFYTDHLKIYHKRPIYWLFSSGKKKGFCALIYMHRYTPSLLTTLRDEYLRPLCRDYGKRMDALKAEINASVASQRVSLRLRLDKLGETLKELNAYENTLCRYIRKGIELDLDDSVAVNYEKFGELLEPIV